MSNVAFKVYERNIKENTNKLRKTGQIPGIIYGEFLDNTISIKISNAELKKMVRENNSGSIIQIDLYKGILRKWRRIFSQRIRFLPLPMQFHSAYTNIQF